MYPKRGTNSFGEAHYEAEEGETAEVAMIGEEAEDPQEYAGRLPVWGESPFLMERAKRKEPPKFSGKDIDLQDFTAK